MDNTPTSRRAARGTDAPYQRGNRREASILDSLEQLLETAPLAAINIGDIATGAGISRPTLYFYFRSRTEVFAALLERTLAELSAPPQELLGAHPVPREVATGLLRHVLRSWREHGTVLRRAAETTDDPAVDRIWQQAMATYVTILSDWIARGRAEGRAIDTGEDPAEVAEALTWMVERCYYQLFRREHSREDEERTVQTLTMIMLRSAGYSG